MASKQDNRNQVVEVQMPDDGTEVEAAEQSPLDVEPARRRAPPKAASKRRVKEYDEPVPAGGQEDEVATFEDDSPLTGDAEAALSMCEVERIGPGDGPGWVGRMFDYGDGNGPQQVSYGRVGSYPRSRDIYDRLQSLVGSGEYRITSRGKPPVLKKLPGVPLPLPSEQEAAAARMGRGPGTFDRFDPHFDPRDQDHGGGQFAERDPFGDGFDPEVGIAPEEIAQTGLNGWYQNGVTGRWQYLYNGAPGHPPRGSKPPIPAAGFGMNGQGPGMYDHDGDDRVALLEKKLEEALKDKRDDRLDKIERLLTEKQQGGAMEAMMTMMMKSMDDAQKAREHEFRMAQARSTQEEKESRARATSDATASVAARQIDLQIAQARATADEKIAAANAAVLQANATAAMANAKEIATITSTSNDKMFSLMMNRTDSEGGLDKAIDRSIKIAEMMGGNKPELSDASEIANAVRETLPALSQAGVDVAYAYRGFPPPQRGPNGQPQGPAGQPPALQNGQAAPPQIPAPASGPIPDAREVAAFVQLGGYLAKNWSWGLPPSFPILRSGILAYGLDASAAKIETQLLLAPPQMVVAEIDKAVQALGNPQVLVAQANAVRAMAADANGLAWFEGLKNAIRAKQAKTVSAAVVPAGQGPALGQPAAVPAPASNVHPMISGVDPSRPVILQDSGPKVVHTGPLPTDILPS